MIQEAPAWSCSRFRPVQRKVGKVGDRVGPALLPLNRNLLSPCGAKSGTSTKELLGPEGKKKLLLTF